MYLVRVLWQQDVGYVAGEKGVGVGPRDELGLRLEHRERLVAGKGPRCAVEVGEAYVAQTLKYLPRARREPLASDEEGFFHPSLSRRGDQQEDAPEVVDVADGDDCVVDAMFAHFVPPLFIRVS